MSESGDSLVNVLLADRYKLLRLVARGGMGEVYEAHDEKRGRRVAIKLLSRDLDDDPEWCERFDREAKVAAEIASPYVARVLRAGRTRSHGGRRWIAFQFLDGESLETQLERSTRLPFAEVDWMMEHLLTALEHMHDADIVHRDIKPSNLMVVRAAVPKLVVLDFGVAKRVVAGRHSSGLTALDSVLGTPAYMSPEQFLSSKTVNASTDLFSAGAVAYRALTGRVPFQHRTLSGMFDAKQRGLLPSLASASGVTWPEAPQAWLAAMVAPRPEDRFDSAQASRRAWRTVREAMKKHVQVAVGDEGKHADTDLAAPITEV
jgi:serine/threonine-protein kinase